MLPMLSTLTFYCICAFSSNKFKIFLTQDGKGKSGVG